MNAGQALIDITAYLRSTRSNSNQNQPLLRRITTVIYYLIVCQISCSLKHLDRFRLPYKDKHIKNKKN